MIPRLLPALPALGLVLLSAGCSPRQETPAATHAAAGRAQALAAQLDADLHKACEGIQRIADGLTLIYQDLEGAAAKADPAIYAFASNGAYHKTIDDGGPAVWVSAVLPVTEQVRQIVFATEQIDAELIRATREIPGVSQAYYNDRHSLNRIYPWFDTIAQYPPRMVIPDFNFYYLANAENNPSRQTVWVDEPYVDPAGRGWMVSVIAPVYQGDQLVGVPGLDVTIADLVSRYFQDQEVPLALIAGDGALVAATEAAVQLLEMPPLRNHKYLETVKLDTYRPVEYNILSSARRPVRALAVELLQNRRSEIPVTLRGADMLVRATPLQELDWIAVEFISR